MTSVGSVLLIFVVTVNTAASHVLLKRGLSGASLPTHITEVTRFVGHCLSSPFVWGSLLLQVMGYAIWVAVVARERLAVATAVSGSFFYILMAVLGWFLFNERLSYTQIIGLTLITAGVSLMSLS
jgi:undecaprenyl phosphate-alpha-L-ara4N flippase subunit ArnE